MMPDEFLRDWYAALALGGILAKLASANMSPEAHKKLAEQSYQMADAMLAAREKVEVVQ